MTNFSIAQFAKTAKLGKLYYKLYYQPRAFVQKCARQGVFNLAIDERNRKQMEKAAYRLQPIQVASELPPVEIHFLTGQKFWYQTCFCAYSMAQVSDRPIRPIIYDDGSLKQKYQNAFRKVFPDGVIHQLSDIEARLDQALPSERFPNLRERRLRLPIMRKLTDIHAGTTGWKLFLDSDMLFFRRPSFLLNWLENPQYSCHMVDVLQCYGYSQALMSELTQSILPDKLNSGISGLESNHIDWEQLEDWCKTMIEREGTHYYQEQALTAMLMTNRPHLPVPAEEYVVLPSLSEAQQPRAVLHHYVSDTKTLYFRYGWKHIVNAVNREGI